MPSRRIVEHRFWITAEIDRQIEHPVEWVYTWTERRRFWKGRRASRARSRAVNYLLETI